MVRKPTTRPALTNAKPDNALDHTEGMPAAKQHAPLSPANKTPTPTLPRKELVFIDQGVDDYPMLIAGVKEGVDIHLIDPTQDGVLQITAILNQQTNISAVHIVSHGNVGYLALGNSVLSTETLTHYQDALFSWRQALDSDADILIYGCNVGKGLSGEAFIQQLALLTGANIAASNNLTGHYKLGGNWQLAYQQGHIKAPLPFEADTTQLYPFVLATTETEYFSTFAHDTHHAPSFTYNEFTYSINDPDYSSSDLREMVHSSDPLLELGGGLGTTTFTIAKTDESEFSLISLTIRDQFNLGATYTVTGWRDGTKVTGDINHTLTRSALNTNTFFGSLDINFRNIDTIKVSGTDVGFSLEDWTYGAAITNTPPTLSISDTNLTYTENTAATQIDASATLSDADGSADWNGGTLVVQITGNNEAADRISISDTDADGTTITTSGTDIMANTVVIGSLSASNGVVTNGSTKLTITFDQDATNDIVQEVLQSIRYDNTSDNPGTTNRTITVTATDTHGAAASDTRTVTVTAVNDAPTLTNLHGDTVKFTIGGSAVSLDASSNLTLADVDSTDFNNGSITVSITNNGQSDEDQLQIGNIGSISITGSDVKYGSDIIGSVTGGSSGSDLVISLNSNATVARVQELLKALQYTNSDATSTNTLSRTVRITVDDGDGGSSMSSAQNITLSLTRKPIIDLDGDDSTGATNGGYQGTFIEGTGAVALADTDSSISDDGTFKSLRADYIGFPDGLAEGLSSTYGEGKQTVNGEAVTITRSNYGSGSGSILITIDDGSAEAETIEMLMESIRYDNTSDTPNTTTTRTINFFAVDNDNNFSSFTPSTITIVAANDPPALTATPTNSTYTEGNLPVSLFSDAVFNAVESSEGLISLTLTVNNVTDGTSEILTIDGSEVILTDGTSVSSTTTNQMTASVSVTDSTATVTLTKAGAISPAAAEILVDGIKYRNTSEDPTAGNRVITLTSIQDSGGKVNGDDTSVLSIASTVSVTSINDAPTLTAIGSNPTFNQGGTAADLFSSITASTVESNQTLERLIITVTNVTDGAGANEFLIIDGEDFALSNGNTGTIATLGIDYSVSLVVGTATVTLTREGMSAAEVETLIEGLAYSNTSSSPSSGNRIVTITSMQDSGGTANGGVDTATLSISSTVTVVPKPEITSATYDASTGTLVVTGTNIQANGSGADIDVSKLTFTGEGGTPYALTDSADVECDFATQFTVKLSATDQAAVNLILNKNGAVSTDVSTYNLAAADDWNTNITEGDTADTTGNGITVSNVAVPTITSATYDANSGALTVTGTGFLSRSGATNDIIAAKFSFTGEGGTTYSLTGSADVEVSSGTTFTLVLSATDKAAVNKITNKNGTSSTGGTTYNLAAAENWAAGTDAAAADTVGNAINVSNVPAPIITSATYDASTGALVVTGTGFLSRSGATNDIVTSKFTFTGEGGETYTLTDSADVEITSGTAFTITLSETDKAAVNQIVNKNGISSTGGTTYNLAAAEDWAAGADAVDADTTGNGITVSNVFAPTITSAAYDYATGVLVVTGENFVKAGGTANDIDVSKFTFTGQGGATYTLIDSTGVEITSGTSFTVTLSATDKSAINLLLNKNGTDSNDATPYNLAADEDWAVGTHAAVNVVDLTGNSITVSNVPAPSSGNGTPPPVNTSVDGIDVSTISQPDGSVLITAPIVTGARQDDPASLHTDYADIPILNDIEGDALLTVSLPVGVGLRASRQPQAQSGEQALNELMQRIVQKTPEGSEERQAITNNGQSFLDALPPGEAINVQTIELTTGGNPTPDVPILITGSDAPTQNKQVLVIDARDLPAGTILQLDNVAFAVIIGAVRTVGGKGQNFVTASGQDQIIILGEDDDILFGGDGSDTVGSLGGSDQVSGDNGDDIVYGGTANDILSGGSGNDQLNGGLGYDIALQEGQLSDYRIDIHGNEVVLTHTNGETDTLTDIEQIRFASGPTLAIAHSEVEAAAHHLAKNWLNRDLTVAEGQAVQDWHGATLDDIIVAFHALPEASGLSNQTSNTLLAGLGENPHILRLDVEREFIGSVDDDQGYLPLGLALHADGDTGHDVLQMQGSRTDVHLEFNGNKALELTRLSDGAMLSLQNAEAIAFDSGDTVILAHNVTEGILGRLFHTFLGRDATSTEWQLGREALASEVDPDIILDWFQQRAGLDALSNSDYIQTIFSQSFGRQATEAELNAQLLRLENNQISREWLAVEMAQTTEAEIHLVGSVMLQEGWV